MNTYIHLEGNGYGAFKSIRMEQENGCDGLRSCWREVGEIKIES